MENTIDIVDQFTNLSQLPANILLVKVKDTLIFPKKMIVAIVVMHNTDVEFSNLIGSQEQVL
jgi:hypothetical protein